MDDCGGKEVNGEYGYYVTVDFPYILQCYKGTPVTNNVAGNCGLYGANCSKGGNGRKRRTTTEEWFAKSLDFHQGQHPYFNAMFGKERRSRRSVDNLTAAIDAYLANNNSNISKETFLRHLAYEVRLECFLL